MTNQQRTNTMIEYNVTLKTEAGSYQTRVEIEDRGNPVQNNGAAIQAAIVRAVQAGESVKEPLRVEQVAT